MNHDPTIGEADFTEVPKPASNPICGASQPSLDAGRPCTKPPGHYGEADNIHVTDNGFWWADDTD